jgi:23S rRNA (cytosine1962-C5)-methyltransferase
VPLSPVLARLPRPGERRIAVRITPDALRQVRGGHPWVFDASLTSISHEGRAGDLAVIFDRRRRFAAIGLWDPTSPIRIRILHVGDPRLLDESFWRELVTTAADRRLPLADSGRDGAPATTGYRLVHGENDGFPGLVADRYDTTLVLKLYTEAWLAHLATVLPLLVEAAGSERVVLRYSRDVGRRKTIPVPDGDVVMGELSSPRVEFREHDLSFRADVVRGQKTGYFLDQRENRVRVGSLAARRHVLDVFSCTGGFSVHAAAGGARDVTSVDLSAQALALAADNMRLNQHLPAVAACSHRIVESDAFVALEQLRRAAQSFDLIVIDPPSFAPKRSAVASALSAYARLTKLALAVLTSGGILVQASCSSRVPADQFYATVIEAAAERGSRLVEIARTQHPLDHPVGFTEGAYLKAIFAEVRPI